MNREMTVKEAFELAFGPIPERATCHLMHLYGIDVRQLPTFALNESVWTVWVGGWSRYNFDGEDLVGCNLPRNPDISGRPAHAFLGFFGEEYDKVVKGE